jgi:hypothetical protein
MAVTSPASDQGCDLLAGNLPVLAKMGLRSFQRHFSVVSGSSDKVRFSRGQLDHRLGVAWLGK